MLNCVRNSQQNRISFILHAFRMMCTVFLQEEELKKAILVVFANKQDMEQAMTPTEVANALGLPALKDRKWQIFKTSATKGIGLEEAMEWYVLTHYTY